ncbi:DUF2288 domain-containing protein [Methylovulum psychrotolerans]|jgi:hypothetical protein|uniref:DUF2288 domain-containing protein n=1 Tax=Methylovulum psychrotolerans TaxID=1704499 RepID=A0A2S5CGK4_9GAMM|nr:DUF2288 domain-containing protein [Methylovulum psychrotolerans]POZ49929.1 hypothetical protein AADEFJLK_04289 [Methylovulum psychrotolerans]
MQEIIDTTLKEKIHLETSQIAWSELQRFFAQGLAVNVGPELDLIDVAYQFAADNKTQVQAWLSAKQIGLVSDPQALQWLEANALVWVVVVKPWLLVQDNRVASCPSTD